MIVLSISMNNKKSSLRTKYTTLLFIGYPYHELTVKCTYGNTNNVILPKFLEFIYLWLG